ncbi:MAG TPA: hypothetical protein PKY82_02745 [Pyrinomonadaceae bacterium]|nr:hypothetical protein [Pyrinomonadaceae bacterium]
MICGFCLIWLLLSTFYVSAPAQSSNVKMIDIYLRKGNPDYVNLSDKRVFNVTSQVKEKNLQSWVVGYKAWSLMGEFVYNPSFYYEIDSRKLVGKTRTVDFEKISKYPDLIKRYQATKPINVDVYFYGNLYANGATNPVCFKISGNNLVYFGSRSSQNYQSPTSPARWKYAISSLITGGCRFTDADLSDESKLKGMMSKFESFTPIEESDYKTTLDIKWDEEAIDEIAELYDKYEKEDKKIDDKLKAIKDEKLDKSVTGYDKDDEMAMPVDPIKIDLEKNFNGTQTTEGVIQIKGKASGSQSLTKKGRIIAEGYEQEFDIDTNGNFNKQVVLKSGINNINISVGSKTIKQQITLNREPVDLRITLTWNTPGSDIDLYLTDPNDLTCYYSNKNAGIMLLDVDNTRGYGPENIYVKHAQPGNYKVRIQNFSDGVGTEATLYIFVNEKLKDVKKVNFTASKQMINIGTYTF